MPRIAAAQTPEFREDIDAALAHALAVIADASAQGADLLVFPEGYLQGYLTQEEPARRHALDLASPAFEAGGVRFAINICYDTNFPDTAQAVAATGASLIVCPANNMMRRPAAEHWRDLHNTARGDRCRETGLWLISADVTGTRGDRIAWGPTAVLDPQGKVAAQLPLDTPGLLVFELPA